MLFRSWLPLNLHAGDVLCGELVSILSTLRGEKEREITEIAQTDFLALKQQYRCTLLQKGQNKKGTQGEPQQAQVKSGHSGAAAAPM